MSDRSPTRAFAWRHCASAVAVLTAVAVVTSPRVAGSQRLKTDVPLPELVTLAQRDSNDPAAHFNLALGYWSKQRWDDAEQALLTASRIDHRFAMAWLALAYLPRASREFWEERVIHFGNGRRLSYYVAADSVVERFYRLYRRAFMIDPLVDIRIAVATEYRVGHVDRFDRALYAYNDSKWEEAVRRFSELAADSSDYRGERGNVLERILFYQGLAAARLGRHALAINAFTRLVDRSQRREETDTLHRWPLRTNEYRYILAYLNQRAGNLIEAIPLFHQVLETDIGLFMAHVQLASIYEADRKWPQALASRRNAVNANPEDPTLLLDLGATLAKAGQWPEAEATLRQAMEANSRDARIPYYLGIVQQQLAKKDDARAAFTRFLAIAPSRYERQIADAKQRLTSLP